MDFLENEVLDKIINILLINNININLLINNINILYNINIL